MKEAIDYAARYIAKQCRRCPMLETCPFEDTDPEYEDCVDAIKSYFERKAAEHKGIMAKEKSDE